MIIENSGKIFRFTLEHGLGYGFAEFYDFSDISQFYGRYVFIYNRIDKIVRSSYNLQEITSSGIALGPITLYKPINTRGVGAWKSILRADKFLITERPKTKDLKGLLFKDDNWNIFRNWYVSNEFPKDSNSFLDYSKVRTLETRILTSNVGVVKKFTMKQLIDSGIQIKEYYDLNDLGTKNLFVQLVNTYYPLEQTLKLLEQIPAASRQNGC